ncbi:type II toxin-antitoxin system VapC family toxin [Candidatus Protofrankia californiensis]|uniref:type II toxin-antitoxin system VapC family toxin n=1 Tax=Candidatus Protofrankia californiensis TaxID=1839754 RepID=UPI00104108A1|nr:type II toxin-antitoxin system VapC family toxin [Candidatus Protofrankia californiensis]
MPLVRRVVRCQHTEWISTVPVDRLYLSVLTIGEITHGITRLLERGDHRQAAVFEGWLDDVIEEFGERIVPVTLTIARAWAARSGAHPVPTVDALIAATAKTHDWTLVTRNTKDFDHTGVRLLNPFTG